jgi:hypothetical protein
MCIRDSDSIYNIVTKRLLELSYNKKADILINRNLAKVVSMPMLYGLKFGGMIRQIRTLYSEDYLLEILGDDMNTWFKWLWSTSINILRQIDLSAIDNIKIMNKIYDLKPNISWTSSSGVPIYLSKFSYQKDKRKRKTKSVYNKNSNGMGKLNIKREFFNHKKIKDVRKTKSGLYVAMIHSSDASIEHDTNIEWSFSAPLIPIHDSNGCPIMLGPIQKHMYLVSTTKWLKTIHNNHPIINIWDSNIELKENLEISEYIQTLKNKQKNFDVDKICDKILRSKRMYF